MPTVIDRATWPRRHHLAFFETFEQPHFCITSEVDVTRLVARMRAVGQRPFPAMLYATTRASNAEAALRLRLRWTDAEAPAELVLHDVIHPSFTAKVHLPEAHATAPGCDLPLFGYATARYTSDFGTFAQNVAAAAASVQADPDLEAHAALDTDDLLFVSSLPWMSYTSVSHAMMVPKRDCTPRVMWGRFVERGDRTIVSTSLQVHHGLADGGHVARWFRRLTQLVEQPDWLG